MSVTHETNPAQKTGLRGRLVGLSVSLRERKAPSRKAAKAIEIMILSIVPLCLARKKTCVVRLMNNALNDQQKMFIALLVPGSQK